MIMYSNGSQVTLLRYFYSEISQSIQKEITHIQLAGVVGITYLEFAEIALCITDNRLFFSVPITFGNRCNDTAVGDEYFELTNELLTEAKQMTCYLTSEVEIGKTITSAIGHEQQKFDILTCINNQSLYRNSIQSKLIFHNTAPARTHDSVWIESRSTDSIIFAEIAIIFQNKIGEILARQRRWNLVLTSNARVAQLQIGTSISCENNSVRLIYPIDRRSVDYQGLPSFQIGLLGVVDHFLDSILLDISLKLNYDYNIGHLFDVTLSASKRHSEVNENGLQNTVRSLICQCEQQLLSTYPAIECCINRTKSVENMVEFLSSIGISNFTIAGKETRMVYAHIENLESSVIWDPERDHLSLKSTSPGMLKELKMLCSEKLEPSEKTELNTLKAMQLELVQCEFQREIITAFYRRLRTSRS
ncbi:uncharacterized protein LOC129776984 [Toxorhynchites rutilus septentrionalis]|uniref:uncharacterized protein LOC129776984 n=1 Tax=Toxorhynchites rutilus septentrionalis TaxID=329112 RepID=UPI002478C1A1|nr:uncharacterized protein LOC129776984 [Toxorhynchites rutilus septentrionalis]